jgi:signal recognition particle subunit SRP54
MTRAERADPSILNASRRRRIALGSGTATVDVNRLVKQFSEMQRVMRMMQKQGGRRPALPFGR